MHQRVDLKSYLLANGTKVKGITVYGMLKGAIIPPPPIDTIYIEGDRTATVIIDVVAIKHGDTKYWTHGEILVNINPFLLQQAKESPTRRLGVEVKGGRLEVSHHGIIAMYKWGMKEGRFVCYNSFIERANMQDNPEIVNVMLGGVANDWEYPFPVPNDQNYQPASGDFRFTYTEEWSFLHTLKIDQQVKEKAKLQYENGSLLKGNATGGGQAVTPTSTVNQPTHPNVPQHNYEPQQPVQQSTNKPHATPNFNPLELNSTPVDTDVVPVKKVLAGFTPRLKSNIVLTNTNKKKPDYHRLEPLEKSKLMEEYKTVFSDALTKAEKMLEGTDEWQSVPYLETVLEQLANGLHKNWERTFNKKALKMEFKELVQKVIERLNEGNMSLEEYGLPEDYELPINSEIDERFNVMGSRLALMLKPSAKDTDFKESQHFYQFVKSFRVALGLGMLEPYLDMRSGALLPLSETKRLDVNAYIHNNIYMLGFEIASLKVEAIDKLRLLFGLPMTEEMKRVRNAMQVHSTLLDSEGNRWLGGSTVHLKTVVESNLIVGLRLNEFQLRNYNTTGSLLSKTKLDGLNAFFEGSITPEDFNLGADYIIKQVDARNIVIMDKSLTPEKVLQDAIDLGVVLELESGETGQVYIASTALAKKEIYIYERLYGMLNLTTINNLTQDMVDESASEFEEMKDEELGLPLGTFKLEARQKEAATLIRYAVAILTGGAGSGKTTTAEFLLYCIQKYLGVDKEEIFFAAPTGKASQRLSEVVKSPAYTIHRLFGLGVGSRYSLKEEHYEKPHETAKVLICDEFSIANIDLTYDMLCRYPKASFIYFLGDDDQLPPIGFGKPLANLLTFLPVVHLNVSKRAAEGSKITVNANRIINPEDNSPLEVDDTMQIVDEKDPNVLVTKLMQLIKYHLAEDGTPPPQGLPTLDKVGRGLTSEDIQVVTPYSNSTVFASGILNRQLQDIYNPLKGGHKQLVTVGWENKAKVENYYRIQDRVIHKEGNLAKKRRYAHRGGNTFEMLESKGVYNGDVGRIIGFHLITDLTIETGNVPDDKLTGEDSSLLKRIETAKKREAEDMNYNPTNLYVSIKFKGVNQKGEEEEYIILYATNIQVDNGYNLYIAPMEFKAIELAYALTTHKLQGSQAKLVMMLSVSSGRSTNKPFVNRNMLYTMLTRAQKGLYLLGDVYGENSTFNKGIKYQSNSSITTLYDIM